MSARRRKVLYCGSCGRVYGRFLRLPPKRTCRESRCPLYGVPRRLRLGAMAEADEARAQFRSRRLLAG